MYCVCISFPGDAACAVTQITAERINEIDCSGVGSCLNTAGAWNILCDPDLNDDHDISCKMLCTNIASCQYQPGSTEPTPSRSMFVVNQIDELVCSGPSACYRSEFILIGAVCDDDANNSFQCECGVRIQCGDADSACRETQIQATFPESLTCKGFKTCASGYFKMVMPNDEFFIACEGIHCIHQNVTGNVLFLSIRI